MSAHIQNFALGALASDMTDSGTSMTLTTEAFSDPATVGVYWIVMFNTAYGQATADPNREVMLVTAKSGAVYTVVRGVDGSTATAKDTTASAYTVGIFPTAAQMFSSTMLNVVSFGADPTGATDSLSAINLAITNRGNRALYFPKGTYEVTATGGPPMLALSIAAGNDLRFVGEGKDLVTIKLQPETPANDSELFRCDANAGDLIEFESMTLEGPDDPGTGGTPVCHGIKISDGSSGVVGGEVRLTNVHLKDFDICLEVDGPSTVSQSDVKVVARDCEFTGTGRGSEVLLHKGGELRARGCTFGAPSTTETCNAVKCFVNVAADFEDCDWTGNDGRGIMVDGGDWGTAPDYFQLTGCRFVGSYSNEVIRTPIDGLMTVVGCVVDPTAGDAVQILGQCTFTASKIAGVIDLDSFETTAEVALFTACEIEQFNGDASNASLVKFQGCVFRGASGRSVYVTTPGNFQFVGCRFEGSPSTAHLHLADTTGGVPVVIEDCWIQNSATIVGIKLASNQDIAGRNVTWAVGGSTGKLFDCTGWTGSGGLRLPEREQEAAVASATTIVLDANFNRYRVTGTTTVDTIQMGDSEPNFRPIIGDLVLYTTDATGFAVGGGSASNWEVQRSATSALTQHASRKLIHSPIDDTGWLVVE